jgi:hypothetical protein
MDKYIEEKLDSKKAEPTKEGTHDEGGDATPQLAMKGTKL